MTDTLKPCPFCWDKPRFEAKGKEALLACNGCPIYFSVCIEDLMSYEELLNAEDNFSQSNYRYSIKFTNRAKEHLADIWNTRAPSKDRELLIELSFPRVPDQYKSEQAIRIRKHLEENP